MATLTGKDILRRVRFAPYRKGEGPTFALTLWDTGQTDWRGASILGYRLAMHRIRQSGLCPICGVAAVPNGFTTNGRIIGTCGDAFTARQWGRQRPVTLFEGEDFAGSPFHAIDSDATVAALMSFLTLRPGAPDPDYFASYTEAQRAFCDAHADALTLEVDRRFGERN